MACNRAYSCLKGGKGRTYDRAVVHRRFAPPHIDSLRALAAGGIIAACPASSNANASTADTEDAARKIVELANAVEPVRNGRIHIEKINGPFLFQLKGTPAEYKAGFDLAIAKGWHESGTFVRFTQAGADLFA